MQLLNLKNNPSLFRFAGVVSNLHLSEQSGVLLCCHGDDWDLLFVRLIWSVGGVDDGDGVWGGGSTPLGSPQARGVQLAHVTSLIRNVFVVQAFKRLHFLG